jgi:hypothetical protein
MKLRNIILVTMALMPFLSNAQQKKGIEYSGFFDSYYWRGPLSITSGIGTAMYSGDLCSDFSCTKPSMYYTVGLGYKLWPRIFIGAEFDYFGLRATDKHESRGYDFTSKNMEVAAYLNYYIVEDIVRRHPDLNKKHKLLKPYIYLGISGMRYNVTENVGETTFPKYTGLVPVGLGLLFDITPRINVKVDAIYKIGFSDYLDGVSEKANPDKNDSYGMMRVKLVYTPKARRVKPKVIKIDEEQRAKWNTTSSDSTKPKAVTPKAEETTPDPDEDDSYYYDEPEDNNSSVEDIDGGDNYYDLPEDSDSEDTEDTDFDDTEEIEEESIEEEEWDDSDW